MKKTGFFTILFVFLSFFSFVADTMSAADTEEKSTLILSDQCRNLYNIKPPKYALDYLQKAGVSREMAENIIVPEEWEIYWQSISNQSTVGSRSAFCLSAPLDKPLEIYAPYPKHPDNSRYYTMELTVSMPAQSRYKRSEVGLGIFQYGYYNIPRKILLKETFVPGEEKTLKTQVDLSGDFCQFRPMISVAGDIVIKNLTVRKNTDDLAAAKMTVVEGILKECSKIPNPAKSDYPNCRFVCRFEGNSIIAGKSCPKEMAVVLEGFENYKYKNTNTLKPGDMVRMLVLPFDELPEDQKSTQQADDLNLFMLDSYYVKGVSKIPHFADNNFIASSGITFLRNDEEEYVSVFKRQLNPPMPEKIQKDRDAAVKKSLEQIRQLLAPYNAEKTAELNEEFKISWQKEFQKDAPGRNRNRGTVWRNVDNSFWTFPLYRHFMPPVRLIPRQNIDALVSFKEFLEANGVHFIVVPIPQMYDISARVINKDFRNHPDLQTASVVKQLLENDIEAIYTSDEIIKNYNRYPFAFFFPNNGHPSDTTQDVITDLLAERLKRYELQPNLDPRKFSTEWFTHVYGNNKTYFFPENCDIGSNKPNTPYQCRKVLYEGKDIFPDPHADIFVMGNSYIQTPMLTPESFPTLLMQKLSRKVAAWRVDAFGPMLQIIPAMFGHPENYISGKKVVILAMGTTSMTQYIDAPDIRIMDQNTAVLANRNLIRKYEVGNIRMEEKKPTDGGRRRQMPQKVQIFHLESVPWDAKKETVLVIPTVHTGTHRKACFWINGEKINIPFVHYHNSAPYSVIYKMPAGTESLKIELEAYPAAIPAVKNIQIYQ